jgi:soluble lytic murein transglycosylase-like protein
MSFSKKLLSTVLILLLGLMGSSAVLADIYCYRDENGVLHFTNVNTESRYRLYMRTSQKNPIEYIKEYDGIIDQASRRFGVDSALIKAVIKAESDFDHQAVSRKGAQGLMQLMPDTADEMRVQDPFDPAENIFGGVRYLNLMLRRFDNDHQLALAAYNAGPENVETYKGVPPFPETKAFIKRVMEYYHEYIAATQ